MSNLFGSRVKELRVNRNFMLRELAAQLNMDAALLSKIENGKRQPRKELVYPLSQILHVPFKELLNLFYTDKVMNLVQEDELSIEILSDIIKKINHNKL